MNIEWGTLSFFTLINLLTQLVVQYKFDKNKIQSDNLFRVRQEQYGKALRAIRTYIFYYVTKDESNFKKYVGNHEVVNEIYSAELIAGKKLEKLLGLFTSGYHTLGFVWHISEVLKENEEKKVNRLINSLDQLSEAIGIEMKNELGIRNEKSPKDISEDFQQNLLEVNNFILKSYQ